MCEEFVVLFPTETTALKLHTLCRSLGCRKTLTKQSKTKLIYSSTCLNSINKINLIFSSITSSSLCLKQCLGNKVFVLLLMMRMMMVWKNFYKLNAWGWLGLWRSHSTCSKPSWSKTTLSSIMKTVCSLSSVLCLSSLNKMKCIILMHSVWRSRTDR